MQLLTIILTQKAWEHCQGHQNQLQFEDISPSSSGSLKYVKGHNLRKLAGFSENAYCKISWPFISIELPIHTTPNSPC